MVHSHDYWQEASIHHVASPRATECVHLPEHLAAPRLSDSREREEKSTKPFMPHSNISVCTIGLQVSSIQFGRELTIQGHEYKKVRGNRGQLGGQLPQTGSNLLKCSCLFSCKTNPELNQTCLTTNI